MLASAVIIGDFGQPVTGGGSYFTARVKRVADGYLLDFDDGAFKNSGWTSPTAALSEYADLPGTYYLDLNTAAWDDGQYQAHFLFNSPDAARVGLGNFLVKGGKEVAAYLGETMAVIPTNPLLATDARLNHLDVAVSTRAPEAGGNVAAIKAKTDNLPADPADQSAVEAAIAGAVGPLALEANVQTHMASVLDAYDPPTRAELTADIASVLNVISALENISIADILAAPLGDGEILSLNSLGDLVRKLYWLAANRLVVLQADGSWTLYQGDGSTAACQGTYLRTDVQTERSGPQWA